MQKYERIVDDYLMEKIKRLATELGFKTTNELLNDGHENQFYLLAEPGNVESIPTHGNLVLYKIAEFQKSLTRLMAERLAYVSGKYGIEKIKVASCTFNGQVYDELMLMPYRLHVVEEKHKVLVFNGRLFRCDTKADVECVLSDLCRFWVCSLRALSESLNCSQTKGSMSFALVNLKYNAERADEHWYRMSDVEIETYMKDSVADIEEVHKRLNPNWTIADGCDFRLMLVDYCVRDVRVTDLGYDALIEVSNVACQEIIDMNVIVYGLCGTPGICQFITKKYLSNQGYDLFAPVGEAYEIIRKSVYGGRSEVKVIAI